MDEMMRLLGRALTRREALLASAALALAGCAVPTGSDSYRAPGGVSVRGEEEAVALMLSDLESRHGEEFEWVEGVPVQVWQDGPTTGYMAVFSPTGDPSRAFSCDLFATTATSELESLPCDDYAQWRFKEAAEVPLREALAGVGGLAGTAVCLRQAPMDRRDWQPEELEEYLSNGYSFPYLEVLLMLPSGGAPRGWARAVAESLSALWGFDRTIYLYAGVEGLRPYGSMDGNLYMLDASLIDAANRVGETPPSTEEILEGFNPLVLDRIEEGDVAEWDGSGGVGDPADRRIDPAVEWRPGHPA